MRSKRLVRRSQHPLLLFLCHRSLLRIRPRPIISSIVALPYCGVMVRQIRTFGVGSICSICVELIRTTKLKLYRLFTGSLGIGEAGKPRFIWLRSSRYPAVKSRFSNLPNDAALLYMILMYNSSEKSCRSRLAFQAQVRRFYRHVDAEFPGQIDVRGWRYSAQHAPGSFSHPGGK